MLMKKQEYPKEFLARLRTENVSHFWHSTKQMAEYNEETSVIIDRGEGYTLTDTTGNEYIDGNSSVWCANLGYSQPRIVAAIDEQLRRLPHASLSAFSHSPAIELAARLAGLSFAKDAHVLYATSGAEAVECMIKIARQYFRQNGQPNRTRIISLKGSYHGHTLGALSASGITAERFRYEPLTPGFSHVTGVNCFRCPWEKHFPGCDFECAGAIDRELEFHSPETIAAILIEPILASSGMYIPPFEYIKRIQASARRTGCLLLLDEVTTGMGRTGKMFFYEHCEIKPDLVAISKGLTAGYQPLSAVIAAHTVFDGFLGSNQSGRGLIDFHTFGGHPAACVAALTVLDIIEEENILPNVIKMGELLFELLKQLKVRHACIGDIRWIGLLFGIEFTKPNTNIALETAVVRSVAEAAMRRGLIVRSLRQQGNVICILPPLIIDTKGIENIARRFDAAIEEIVHDST